MVVRTKKTIPQVEMKSRESRMTNMNEVFNITTHAVSFSSSMIVLFDDVFTTGATMKSAANVLKRAGAGQVWAVTMAR